MMEVDKLMIEFREKVVSLLLQQLNQKWFWSIILTNVFEVICHY